MHTCVCRTLLEPGRRLLLDQQQTLQMTNVHGRTSDDVINYIFIRQMSALRRLVPSPADAPTCTVADTSKLRVVSNFDADEKYSKRSIKRTLFYRSPIRIAYVYSYDYKLTVPSKWAESGFAHKNLHLLTSVTTQTRSPAER